ncbi:hypothetical protein [Rhodopirellula sallentina]|uniref:Uncharacterized protein n=1 Tax=Rhodopirellula sallentina SM41 TaxID=1263870 RepID=M5U8Y8_9BACT|nr:hypothetical protein [Rhodopirellula sallentina]EMI52438.1 hypothetical protein RSSM_06150 [Rhodopirellula sallentina SM41]
MDEQEEQEWQDASDWDDEDYDEFLQREFPDSASGNRNGLPSHWKWTAWVLLFLAAAFWILSL